MKLLVSISIFSNYAYSAAPPPIPLNVQVFDSDTGNYNVTWGTVEEAEYYKLWERRSDSGWKLLQSNIEVDKNQLLISNRTNGLYYYVIHTCIKNDCSDLLTAKVTVDLNSQKPKVWANWKTASINYGGEATFEWNSLNADECVLDNIKVETSGSKAYTLLQERTQTVTCINKWGASSQTLNTATARIGVKPSPIPLNVKNIESATGDYTIEWGAANNVEYYILWEKSLTLEWEIIHSTSNAQTHSFEVKDRKENTYDYVVHSCNSHGCTDRITARATVVFPPNISEFKFDKTDLKNQETATLSWNTERSKECKLDGELVGTTGSAMVIGSWNDITKTLVCTNSAGSVTAQETIKRTDDPGSSNNSNTSVERQFQIPMYASSNCPSDSIEGKGLYTKDELNNLAEITTFHIYHNAKEIHKLDYRASDIGDFDFDSEEECRSYKESNSYKDNDLYTKNYFSRVKKQIEIIEQLEKETGKEYNIYIGTPRVVELEGDKRYFPSEDQIVKFFQYYKQELGDYFDEVTGISLNDEMYYGYIEDGSPSFDYFIKVKRAMKSLKDSDGRKGYDNKPLAYYPRYKDEVFFKKEADISLSPDNMTRAHKISDLLKWQHENDYTIFDRIMIQPGYYHKHKATGAITTDTDGYLISDYSIYALGDLDDWITKQSINDQAAYNSRLGVVMEVSAAFDWCKNTPADSGEVKRRESDPNPDDPKTQIEIAQEFYRPNYIEQHNAFVQLAGLKEFDVNYYTDANTQEWNNHTLNFKEDNDFLNENNENQNPYFIIEKFFSKEKLLTFNKSQMPDFCPQD